MCIDVIYTRSYLPLACLIPRPYMTIPAGEHDRAYRTMLIMSKPQTSYDLCGGIFSTPIRCRDTHGPRENGGSYSLRVGFVVKFEL